MAGNIRSAGWKCALLSRYIGCAVAAPSWYMRAESQAVRAGRQVAATCGLHAVNHCLHSLHHVFTWAEFDARAMPNEKNRHGDWEAAVLQRNVEAVGGFMTPMIGDAHQDLARWCPDIARLALWTPGTLGCVVHVPGHWVALTRPEGAQTEQAAALLCDSLHQRPCTISVEEVGELFAVIAARQQVDDLERAGEWSVYVISR